jgi:hypothetical protein
MFKVAQHLNTVRLAGVLLAFMNLLSSFINSAETEVNKPLHVFVHEHTVTRFLHSRDKAKFLISI